MIFCIANYAVIKIISELIVHTVRVVIFYSINLLVFHSVIFVLLIIALCVQMIRKIYRVVCTARWDISYKTQTVFRAIIVYQIVRTVIKDIVINV